MYRELQILQLPVRHLATEEAGPFTLLIAAVPPAGGGPRYQFRPPDTPPPSPHDRPFFVTPTIDQINRYAASKNPSREQCMYLRWSDFLKDGEAGHSECG